MARYTSDFVPVPAFAADPDTMALYHFDEDTGGVAHDVSGNHRRRPVRAHMDD